MHACIIQATAGFGNIVRRLNVQTGPDHKRWFRASVQRTTFAVAFCTFTSLSLAQTINPTQPSQEFVRLGGRIVAIENGESVSAPSVPAGYSAGTPNTSYTYSTGGSTDSFGNPVQYEFTWGDELRMAGDEYN